MPAKLLACGVLVDTALVGEEILVDGEGTLDGAVRHDFRLDLARGNRVGRGTELLVDGIGHVVASDAATSARGSRRNVAARLVLARFVVITVGQAVWLATLVGVVVPACTREGSPEGGTGSIVEG